MELVHSAVIRHRTFVSQLGDLRTAARTIELVCFFWTDPVVTSDVGHRP